jgi:hypothetical protein
MVYIRFVLEGAVYYKRNVRFFKLSKGKSEYTAREGRSGKISTPRGRSGPADRSKKRRGNLLAPNSMTGK